MNKRIIARLDVKMQHLIKGMRLEGWRKVGDPEDQAVAYYNQGIDELLYMDVVASLYERNNLADIVKSVASQVFIPITVGGGIRTLDAVKDLLAVGADKVAVNTAATKTPDLINQIADTYGSQAMVVSIEAKKKRTGNGWECLTDNGRNLTGLDVIEWAQEVAERGAGELLLTSVDQDGTGLGMDVELVQAVCAKVDIPVIASGGVSKTKHVLDVFDKSSKLSAVALAKALHLDLMTVPELRDACRDSGILVRNPPELVS